MSFNKMFIMGRLGRDPQLRQTEKGFPMCYLAVATNEIFKEQELTTWYQVILWGNQAEQAQKTLTKGSNIYIEGRLRPQQMKDKYGALRTVLEISCTDFRCLDRKQDIELETQKESKPEPKLESKAKSKFDLSEDFDF